MPNIYYWIFLFFAILFGVAGASFLKACAGFTKLVPTALMFATYLVSLYLFSIALKGLYLSIAYAVWSGLGVLMVTIVGIVLFGEKLSFMDLVFIVFILIGVIGLNLSSLYRK